jgi:hypothetical protein
MSTKFFAFQSTYCEMLTTSATKFCIPEKEICFEDPNGLITICGNEYNCSECCDAVNLKYFIPFETTDTLMVQSKIFDFYNADRENPLDGFGTWIEAVIVDLSDSSEQDISVYEAASGSYVGWNGKNSYQVISLDGSLLPDCFKILYRVYNNESPQEELQELCTQHFKKVDCQVTKLIQGIRTGFDSDGNYYGLPTASFGDTPFEFNNQMRFEAEIRDAVPDKTTRTVRNRNVIRTTKYLRRVDIYAVPMYIIKYLENVIIPSKYIKIDGDIYTAETGTVDAVEGTCFFNISFNLITIKDETEC